ncbi:MAG: hypothetical protein J5930_05820 [Treponema sp.]|nr:hypothetical protein [Treponema sp.]
MKSSTSKENGHPSSIRKLKTPVYKTSTSPSARSLCGMYTRHCLFPVNIRTRKSGLETH